MSQGLTDRLASPWSRLWQVPLFVAALTIFGIGVRQFYQAQVRKQPAFEVHVADISTLLQQKQYERALKQIAAVQGHFTAPAQEGALEELAGHAFFLAQQEQPVVVEENCRKAIEHYQRAVRLGAAETALIKLRWGLSALWLKDYPTATARLEAVVQEEPAKLAELARPLVGAYLASAPRADAKALALLEKLKAAPGLDDRVWALTRRLELASGSPAVLDRAVADAVAALPGIAERDPAGILLCGMGRGEIERGRLDVAEKYLRDARSRFVQHHLEDGRAALLLGRIMQARGQLEEARALYQEVITSHAGTSLMAGARLGRAEVAALEGAVGEPMQADYEFVIKQLTAVPRPKVEPELVSLEAVRASLFTQHQRCVKAGKSSEALVFVALQEELKEPEAPDFAFRKAQSYELLAEDLFARAAAAPPGPQRAGLFQQGLTAAGSAAEAYLRHAKLTTISNDEVSGDSQWKAAQLFDRAGRTEDSIKQYKEFIAQRPEDRKSRVPEGLHRIGLLYQSLGRFDQAIPAFQRNMREHPKTTWSYASTVQLARCYMAQGEPEFPKAEQTLLSIVQESADLLPSANEFRVSLFTLGELYYRTRRWSDAILRLEEAIARYPEDKAVPRATFWLADAYRKSAADIAEALVKDPQIERRDQLEQARQARLRRAGGLFAKVIADLDPEPGRPAATEPAGSVEEDYLHFAYLYRADCAFDLGEYTAAIKLYDQAATRFATELTAVAAYVQVVNAYLALKEPAQAQAAAERARWILKRIPDEAFGKGPLALSRQYYEDFLKLGRSVP